MVNNLALRGRRLGADIWTRAAQDVPLDLVGMGWQQAGGIGEIAHAALPEFLASYRFFFNPIRYTSLGLAVCEAMAAGLPIVGLATTEMVTAVPNGLAGYLDTSVEKLIPRMRELLADPDLARHMGAAGRHIARERFGLKRFVRDWNHAFQMAVHNPSDPALLTKA